MKAALVCVLSACHAGGSGTLIDGAQSALGFLCILLPILHVLATRDDGHRPAR
jgi:hypothetical protein